jgi:xylulose-5-phosphate/fructose-6-phosphate phosphoketolase
MAEILPTDDHVAADGRVMEMLSEHQCEGWLEGYLLTGRHGFFSCYEAFIHIIDSMFNQHAKWLKVCERDSLAAARSRRSTTCCHRMSGARTTTASATRTRASSITWSTRRRVSSASICRRMPTPCSQSPTTACGSRNYVNVIVAGKQPSPQWLDIEAAITHCTPASGIWHWAGTDGGDPDVVLACAGDVPTLETLAAAALLREHLPELRVRVVNVVDLMKLQPPVEHPHGLNDADFDALFTTDKPIIFAYHGYPWLIHRLTYRRHNHANLHVRGYKEEGTTSTPFDMVVLNDMDRFHLVIDVIDRVPKLAAHAADLKQAMRARLSAHAHYIREHGEDLPEIRDWVWPGANDVPPSP